MEHDSIANERVAEAWHRVAQVVSVVAAISGLGIFASAAIGAWWHQWAVGLMAEALLVIMRSANGRDGWTPVAPADVPAWVKEGGNMAKLVAGEMCMKADEGMKGSDWYRAEKLESQGETKQ